MFHNSSNKLDSFVYTTCNIYKKHLVETRIRCSICKDFDICVTCYQRDGHTHPMGKLSFGDFDVTGEIGAVAGNSGGVVAGSSSSNISPRESRRLSIQRCIQNLVHACQCRNTNLHSCPPSCYNMKRVVQHAKSCKRKSNQNQACPICKHLIALCCYHAKRCQENIKCPVPYCFNIKHKLGQQQFQQRLQQAQILKRHIASMSQQPTSQHDFCLFQQQSTVSNNRAKQ